MGHYHPLVVPTSFRAQTDSFAISISSAKSSGLALRLIPQDSDLKPQSNNRGLRRGTQSKSGVGHYLRTISLEYAFDCRIDCDVKLRLAGSPRSRSQNSYYETRPT